MNKKIFRIYTLLITMYSFFVFCKNINAETASFVSPTISLQEASSINNNQAILNAKIENINNLEYVEWWFEYGVLENSLIYKTAVTKETAAKAVTYTLSSLSQDSIYYYRFCEKNVYETSCTSKKSFKTYSLPIVDILSASQIGYGSTSGSIGYGAATLNGRITHPGTDSKGYGADYWFEYGIGSSLSNSKSTTVKNAKTQTVVSETLNDLLSSSEYYYKLCAKNSINTVCSSTSNFTTYSNVVPVVASDKPVVSTLDPVQTSTANSIKLVGNVSKMGIYSRLNYYFEYDENINFRNSINESKYLSQAGDFNYTLPGITYNKTYYYRACISGAATNTNSGITLCGEPKTFTLVDYKNAALGVKPYSVLKVTDSTAKISGIVTGFGGYDSANVWFITYSSNNSTSSYGYGETIKESDKIQVSGTSTIFSTDLTSLIPGKKYSYSVCIANSSSAYCSNDRKYFYTLKNPETQVSDYSISGDKLYVNGKILGDSDLYKDTVSYGWFEYGNTESLSNLTQTTKSIVTENKLKSEITGLTTGLTYYIRFCVNVGLSDTCSAIKKVVFEKTISEPAIEIYNIDKNQNNIKVYARVNSFGGDEKVSAYLEYGTTSSKLQKMNSIEVTKEGDEVFGHINNIKNDNKYYYRYCVKNTSYTKCTDIKEILLVSSSVKKSIPEMSDDDKVNFFTEEDYAKEKSGQILIKSDDLDNIWYVNPKDSKRYLIGNKDNFYLTFEKLLNKTTEGNLAKIPVYLDFSYGKDTDGDGISDLIEKAIGTNYKLKDSDKDGFSDLVELKNNYSPNSKKAIRLSFDNNVIKNSVGKFYITNNNDIWYVSNNKKRYYLGNTSDKSSIFNSLKKIANKIDYEDLIRIDYKSTEDLFSDLNDSDYDGITDKYEINL